MSNRVSKQHHLEPARSVLLILGRHAAPSIDCERRQLSRGIDLASQITGRAESTVYRWLYDKTRGGTGGRVPQGDIELLLEWSAKCGKRTPPLKSEHFFLRQTRDRTIRIGQPSG